MKELSIVPTCDEFLCECNLQDISMHNYILMQEKQLDALCDYYTTINEGVIDTIKNKLSDAGDAVADFIVYGGFGKDIAKFAIQGWTALRTETKEAVTAAVNWFCENQDAIFLVMDIIDYTTTAISVFCIATGVAAPVGLAVIGAKTAVKGGLKALCKKVGKELFKNSTKVVVKTGKKTAFQKIKAKAADGGIGYALKTTAKRQICKKVEKIGGQKAAHLTSDLLNKGVLGTIKHRSAKKLMNSRPMKKIKAIKEKIFGKYEAIVDKFTSKLTGKVKSIAAKRYMRAKLIKRWVRRRISKYMEILKKVVNIIKGIIITLFNLFKGSIVEDNVHTDYQTINLFRRNILSDKFDFDSIPKDVNKEYVDKWIAEGLEEDNKEKFSDDVKEFSEKCQDANVDNEITRCLVSFIYDGVDLSKDEYLDTYIKVGSEIKNADEEISTGATENEKEEMSIRGEYADETTEAFERMTDNIEKFLLKNGFKKNKIGSEFVSKENNVKFQLKTLTNLYWTIMKQFVESYKD